MLRTFLQRSLAGSLFVVLGLNAGFASVAYAADEPTVSAVSPMEALVGVPVSLSASYTNFFSGVGNCYLTIDGGAGSTAMTQSSSGTANSFSGSVSQSYTFSTTGMHTASVKCGTSTVGATTSIFVSDVNGALATTNTGAPSLGTVSPSSAMVGTAVTVSADYQGFSGNRKNSCYLVVDGVAGIDTMSPSMGSNDQTGTVTRSYTFSVAGSYRVRVQCGPSADLTTSVETSVTVTDATTGTGTTGAVSDSVAPTVGVVTPVTANFTTPTTFSASYSDAVGVKDCYLYVNGMNAGLMTRTASASGATTSNQSGIASASYTFTSNSAVSTNVVRVECTDDAGNRGVGASTSISVSSATSGATGADTTAPVVNAVVVSTAVVNTPVSLATTFSDAMGVTACYLYVDSVSVGAATRTGTALNGAASLSYTFTTTGNHTARVECVDATGNRGIGANKTIAVSSSAAVATDATLPTVASLSYPSAITAGAPSRFETSVSDAGGVSGCSLLVNGASAQVMSLIGTTSNYTSATAAANFTFTVAGTYNVRTECIDTAGNRSLGPVSTISVGAAGTTSDSTTGSAASAPVVSSVYPGSVGVGAQTSYAATFTSSLAVNGCSFYVNDVYTGVMGLSGGATNGAANYLHIFTSPGTYQVRVECVDTTGRRGVGPTRTVTVTSGAVVTTTPETATGTSGTTAGTTAPSTEVRTTLPPGGTLIKAPCPDGALSDNPCKAVYYYSRNGTRYAFPHERIFLTWYANFDSVIQVSDAVMASIRLSGNVAYRPGVRMVKFTTVPQVYVVGRGGVLRWITSEALAVSLYGPNWNQNVHDIPDTYFNSYTFGANINSASDFSPIAESLAVPTIDDNR